MIRLHGIPIWVRDASLDQFCLGPRFQKDNLPFVKMRERKLIGLHAMCEHIERRKTRATTISHGVFDRLLVISKSAIRSSLSVLRRYWLILRTSRSFSYEPRPEGWKNLSTLNMDKVNNGEEKKSEEKSTQQKSSTINIFLFVSIIEPRSGYCLPPITAVESD